MTTYARARTGDLVVTPAGATPGAAGLVARLARRSEPVARFPSGLTVRQLGHGSAAQSRADRQELGRRLLADTHIRLTPRAWSRLAAGEVDPRLLNLLERVARTHTIDVSAFPLDPMERAADAPAHAMRVTAIDGQLVGDADGEIPRLRAVLLSQPRDVRPDSVVNRRGAQPPVLVVRVLLPGTRS